jgi:hypothetical protein
MQQSKIELTTSFQMIIVQPKSAFSFGPCRHVFSGWLKYDDHVAIPLKSSPCEVRNLIPSSKMHWFVR